MYTLDSTCTQVQTRAQIVPFRYCQFGMSEIGPAVDVESLHSGTVDWVSSSRCNRIRIKQMLQWRLQLYLCSGEGAN